MLKRWTEAQKNIKWILSQRQKQEKKKLSPPQRIMLSKRFYGNHFFALIFRLCHKYVFSRSSASTMRLIFCAFTAISSLSRLCLVPSVLISSKFLDLVFKLHWVWCAFFLFVFWSFTRFFSRIRASSIRIYVSVILFRLCLFRRQRHRYWHRRQRHHKFSYWLHDWTYKMTTE